MMMKNISRILIIIGSLAFTLAVDSEVRVKTTEGIAVGRRPDSKSVINFFGIPYAGATSGEKRFKDPAPPPKYEGEFWANQTADVCAHPRPTGVIGVEDCLTLDIVTNNVSSKYPVLVSIIGDDYSYANDSSGFDYSSTAEAGLVVISLNYRLSIFGFLCLGVPEAPGNAGLKDVVAALKWIQANAAAFGGDRNNVVLLGHGSGAAMVDLLTMSPLSKGLVHKAIALSGSALSPWAVAYDPVGYAQALGTKLGFKDVDRSKLALSLRTVDISELMKGINSFDFINDTVLFAPCVENDKLSGSFLTKAPYNVLESGDYLDIPYITGYVDKDGTLRLKKAIDGKWLEKMQENFDDFLPANLIFNNEQSKKNVSQILRNIYFGDAIAGRDSQDNLIDYEGDSSIITPVITSAKKRKNLSKSEVRLLEFAFNEVGNPGDMGGTVHGHILDYIFERRNVSPIAKTNLRERIVDFAKTGNPKGPGRPSWLPLKKNETIYFSIKGDPVLNTNSELSTLRPREIYFPTWVNIYNDFYRTPEQITTEVSHGTTNVAAILIPILLLLLIIITGVYFRHKIIFFFQNNGKSN